MSERQTFAYEMSPAEVESLKAKVAQINLGDRPDKVIGLLGKPDDDRIVTSKVPADAWQRRNLTYYVRRASLTTANENYDRLLIFAFDERANESLMRIHSNVEGIPDKP